MKLNDIVRLSVKNVSRGKYRVVLPVLSVAIGVCAVILLSSAGKTVQKFIDEKLGGFGLDGLMVYAGDRGGLSADDGENISECFSEIRNSMPFEFWFAYYNVSSFGNEPCLILGADEHISEYMDLEIIQGRGIMAEDCVSGEAVCIVDSRLAAKKFGHSGIIGEKICLEADGRKTEFTVAGVCSSSMESTAGLLGLDIPPFIYVPWTSLGLDSHSDIGQMVLKLEDNADSQKTAEKVKNYLADTEQYGKSFEVEDMSSYRQEFTSVTEKVTLVLTVTAGISLVVAALGITGAMFSGVSERKAEIGICKSMGASSGEICLMFLTESVIITVTGCIMGAVSGISLMIAVFYCIFGAFPEPDLSVCVFPCVASVMTGLFSGVIPALNAAKLSPLNAIRKE